MVGTVKRIKTLLLALLCGGMPLVTSGWCDPYTGAFEFFRDDDSPGFADVYYDSYYGGGYYYDDYYYDPYYYDEVVYVDDCYYGCW